MVQARNNPLGPGPWSLPQITHGANKKVFLEECEDFFDLLLKLQGGSSSGGGGSGGYGRYQDDYDYQGGRRQEDYNDDYYRDGSRRDSYGMDGRGDDGSSSYMNDDYYYDDRGRPPPSKRTTRDEQGGLFSSTPALLKNGDKTKGFAMLGTGTLITVLGITLFLNRALMRLGNIIFVAGIPVTMSLSWTMKMLLNPEKMRGTVCFGLGFFLVLSGNPMLGMFLEFFGFLNLFGNMFPMAFAIAKSMPVIGPILKGITNSNGNNKNKNTRRRDNDRDGYDDERRRSDDDYYYYGEDERRGSNEERYY